MVSNEAVFVNLIVRPARRRPKPESPTSVITSIGMILTSKLIWIGRVSLITVNNTIASIAVKTNHTSVLARQTISSGTGFRKSWSNVPTCFSNDIETDASLTMSSAKNQ